MHINKNKIRPKVKKRAIPIYTKDISYDDLVEEINKNLPIKVKIKDVVNHIHNIYPFISKIEIALIVKNTFEVIREQILFGNKINVKYLFNEFYLSLAKRNKFICLEAKGNTTPKIRRKENE